MLFELICHWLGALVNIFGIKIVLAFGTAGYARMLPEVATMTHGLTEDRSVRRRFVHEQQIRNGVVGPLRRCMLRYLRGCILDGKRAIPRTGSWLIHFKSEAAIALSYPEPYNQGKFLGENDVVIGHVFTLKCL